MNICKEKSREKIEDIPGSKKQIIAYLVKTCILIFVIEIFVMLMLSRMPPMPLFKGAIFDAFVLTLLILPTIYFSLVRPVISHLNILKCTEEELHKSEEKYRSLVESTEDSIYLVDKDYKYVFMNRKHTLRAGLSIDQYYGRSYGEFHSPEETKQFIEKVDRVFQTGESVQHEHKSLRDGRYFLRTLSPVKDIEGKTVAVTVISKHISDRKRMEEELLALSLTDELTGLYNRRGFFTLAEQQMRLADRLRRGMLLISADLDGLKWINDTFGHKEGDEVLKETAHILKEGFREADIIARMGGDEFVILVIDGSEETFEILSGRLQKILDGHNIEKNRNYNISLSIGMAFYGPESSYTIDELLIQADKSMYEHKKLRQKV